MDSLAAIDVLESKRLRKGRRPIKPQSITRYKSTLRKEMKSALPMEYYNSPVYLDSVEEDPNRSSTQKKGVFTAVLSLAEATSAPEETIEDIRNRISAQHKIESIEKKETYMPRRVMDKASEEEINRRLDSLRNELRASGVSNKNRLETLTNIALVLLVESILPRGRELIHLVVEDDDKNNYLDLESKVLHLRIYKTAKTYLSASLSPFQTRE